MAIRGIDEVDQTLLELLNHFPLLAQGAAGKDADFHRSARRGFRKLPEGVAEDVQRRLEHTSEVWAGLSREVGEQRNLYADASVCSGGTRA